MKSNKNIAVLVVAFLGVPETVESKLKNSENRYLYTKTAFLSIQRKIIKKNLYLGLVGDCNECNKFIDEFGLDEKNAKWFEQDQTLISSGVGALENQLILNCINFWDFEKNYDLVVKVTGKYEVLNIDDILKFSIYISQPFYAWKYFFKEMVDTRVFLFKPSFYILNQIFFKNIKALPGFWVENITYQLIVNNFFKFGFILYRPILKGWAGTTNEFSITPIYKRVLIKTFSKLDIFFKKWFFKYIYKEKF